MRTVSALLFSALVVFGLLEAAVLLASGRRLQGGLSDIPELVHYSEKVEARSKDLDAQLNELIAIDFAKTQLLKELIVGRLSLFETTDRYRELTLRQPHLTYNLCSQAFPGRPEQEVWLRMVIRDARMLILSENQPEGLAALCRLEAEFEKIRQLW